MKYCPGAGAGGGERSLSARRAWIEIGSCTHIRRGQPRRSPQGERGLKFGGVPPGEVFKRRSPQGERGLKFVRLVIIPTPKGSLSARRAWIEIRIWGTGGDHGAGRSPQGERGLKYDGLGRCPKSPPSLSARRAWIEIIHLTRKMTRRTVALRKESVD